VQAYRWYRLSMAHLVLGEADDDTLQELNQDLSEVSARMTGAQVAAATRLADGTNVPFLR